MAINWKTVATIPSLPSFDDQMWVLLRTLESPPGGPDKRLPLHFVKGKDGLQNWNIGIGFDSKVGVQRVVALR